MFIVFISLGVILIIPMFFLNFEKLHQFGKFVPSTLVPNTLDFAGLTGHRQKTDLKTPQVVLGRLGSCCFFLRDFNS